MDNVNYKEPLVSVVIPVYNAEKSLEKCLNSVLSQNYTNIEVILVDDGSHDSSPDICEKYKSQNPGRVIVVRQKNGGPSAARNKGIKLSHGKYIAFVDSDDTVVPEMISKMVQKAEEENVEMVICAYWLENRKEKKEIKYRLPEGLYSNGREKEVLYSLMDENLGDVPPYSWVRLTKKKVIEESGLCFNEKLYRSEDYHFWVRLHAVIQRVYLLSQTPLYVYFENTESVTHNHVSGYWDDVLFIYSDLSKYLAGINNNTEMLDIMLVKRSLIALNNATFAKQAREAKQEIDTIINNTLLLSVIVKIEKSKEERFKRYRKLMKHRLTRRLIAVKYMIRFHKYHKS